MNAACRYSGSPKPVTPADGIAFAGQDGLRRQHQEQAGAGKIYSGVPNTMPRSYRYVIAAAFGWLTLCGAQPPAKQAERDNKSTEAAPAAMAAVPTPMPAARADTKFVAYRGYDPDPCYRAEDKDAADLCAQWRSAIAGEKAAHEARRATTWSIVATLLNALGLLAVGTALYLTVMSNRIARDTARRQLRAYLYIEPGGVNESQEGFHRIPFNIINSGPTPAHDLETFGDILIVGGTPRDFDPTQDGRYAGETLKTTSALGANTNRWSYAYLQEDIVAPYWEDITTKKKAIIHYGFVRYKDVFDISHETHFAFYHWGEELSDLTSLRCTHGNNVT